MLYFIVKTFVTTIVVVTVAEVAKRSSLLAGLIILIPLTTFLALIWLYWETKDIQKIIDLSNATLLMIVPSLTFFIFLPILIKLNLPFAWSMIGSVLLTAACYFFFLLILQKTNLYNF